MSLLKTKKINAEFNDKQDFSYYLCDDGVEKSVPFDHHLSSNGKTCVAADFSIPPSHS